MSVIETRLFRYFVAVAEELHFTQAALRLGISPPTLTQQIQKLEGQLGVKLLKRKGNTKVVVTEAGQRFLAGARETLRNAEQAAVHARHAARGELGRLELGFMTVVSGAGLLRSWIGPFHQAHPAIEITTRKLVPMAQIGGIQRRELDAGFTRPPRKYPSGVRGFEVYRQGLVLALPSEHPLARHKAITPAMLAREAFVSITPEHDIGFFGHTETIARIGNFTPRVVKRDDDFIAVLAYVALGYGVAVVPELMMKTTKVSDVVYRNIAGNQVPQMSIAFIYGSDPSPPTKLLIRHMQRHAFHNGGKDASPPHHQDRIIIPSALNLDPHPEVRAKGAPRRMQAPALGPRPSRLGAARRGPQGEEISQR
jgi:DNA-binding transcriptional LysR family regulator